MKGDFSRRTFDPTKHYSGALLQQGRVLTEADWTEEHDILVHRARTGTGDVVGDCGGPIHEAGFHLVTDVADLTLEEQALPGNQDPPGSLDSGDFLISAGRYYVDGILIENEEIVRYSDQPDLPGEPFLEDDGLYLLYLDVWQRHLTALDDPSIREVALGGADTSTRTKAVWQVRAWPVPEGEVPEGGANCLAVLPGFDNLTAPSEGRMSARASVEEVTEDPCIVPPGAGYRGLENQLYRVEVHDPGVPYDVDGGAGVVAVTATPEANRVTVDGGAWDAGQPVEVFLVGTPMQGTLAHIVEVDADTGRILTLNTNLRAFTPEEQPQVRLRPVEATFVWSRDNGSVVTTIEEIDGTEVTVHDLGPDSVLGFAPGQWVEITDDRLELNRLPGQLTQIAGIDPVTRIVTLTSPVDPLLDPLEVTGVDTDLHPKLRRWDGAGAVRFDSSAPEDSWIELESGVEVRFSLPDAADPDVPDYRTGDYWQIAARTATADALSGNIEWPQQGGEPLPLPPRGIDHYYCRLSLATVSDGEVASLTDCRNLFPQVTEFTSMYYVGGDGQEAMPDPTDLSALLALGHQLQVGVANGQWPVDGATVRFQVTQGNGQVDGATSVEIQTVDGIAACSWEIDSETRQQHVEATLLLDDGTTAHLPVHFNANLSRASDVSYDPSACPDLEAAEVRTVQQAIDELCQRETRGGCCRTVGRGGEFERIDQAIDALLEEGQREICICLLPGEHEWSGLELVNEEVERELRLKIAGSVPDITVLLQRDVRLERFASFTLQDVDLVADLEVGLAFDWCREVEISGCRLTGVVSERSLLSARAVHRFRLAETVIEAAREPQQRTPIRILDGIDPIDRLYGTGHPMEFRRFVLEVANEIAGRNRDERESIAGQILERLRGLEPHEITSGETISYERLADSLLIEAIDPGVLVDRFTNIQRAAIKASPGMAVEIVGADDLDQVRALGVSGDAETIIENDDIAGLLVLYGRANGTEEFPEGTLQRLAGAFRERRIDLVGNLGALHLNNNRLTRVVVSQATIERLVQFAENQDGQLTSIFQAIYCTDNTIEGDRNIVVSQHLSLSSNDFPAVAAVRLEVGQEALFFTPATIVADSWVAVANHFPRLMEVMIFQASVVNDQAANLGLDEILP